MDKLKFIPINIWDDFYDDGSAPKGEELETYIYVEDNGISQEECKEYLEVLLGYINKNLNIDGVKLWIELYESQKKYPNLALLPDTESLVFDRWEIRIEGLTHKRLGQWMGILEHADIKVDGIPFNIYSGS